MAQKPVYSLNPGDVFQKNGNWWSVDEVIPPKNWTTLREVNTPPGNFTVLAHKGQSNQRFYLQGCALVELKPAK